MSRTRRCRASTPVSPLTSRRAASPRGMSTKRSPRSFTTRASTRLCAPTSPPLSRTDGTSSASWAGRRPPETRPPIDSRPRRRRRSARQGSSWLQAEAWESWRRGTWAPTSPDVQTTSCTPRSTTSSAARSTAGMKRSTSTAARLITASQPRRRAEPRRRHLALRERADQPVRHPHRQALPELGPRGRSPQHRGRRGGLLRGRLRHASGDLPRPRPEQLGAAGAPDGHGVRRHRRVRRARIAVPSRSRPRRPRRAAIRRPHHPRRLSRRGRRGHAGRPRPIPTHPMTRAATAGQHEADQGVDQGVRGRDGARRDASYRLTSTTRQKATNGPSRQPAAAVLGQSVHARPEHDDSAPVPGTDELLAARLATAPGLVRAGASCWDHARTPIHALSMESAYADPQLLRDLGARGARFAPDIGVEVVVGAETAGVPLAASISLTAELPFAFVRKPGYRGHEIDEPPVRGADVAGRRVLLVDDAISSGASVERFTASLAGVGAEVVGVFVLVDMRDVADTVSPVAAALPTECGEHVSAGARPRHGQRPARSCPPQAHRRRDREPMDRRRSALGSPARDRRRSLDSPVTGGLPVCRGERARGHRRRSRIVIVEDEWTRPPRGGCDCSPIAPPGRRPRKDSAMTNHAATKDTPPAGHSPPAGPLHRWVLPMRPPQPIDPRSSNMPRSEREFVQNRIADAITTFAGSMAFVYIQILRFGCWIGLAVEAPPTIRRKTTGDRIIRTRKRYERPAIRTAEFPPRDTRPGVCRRSAAPGLEGRALIDPEHPR